MRVIQLHRDELEWAQSPKRVVRLQSFKFSAMLLMAGEKVRMLRGMTPLAYARTLVWRWLCRCHHPSSGGLGVSADSECDAPPVTETDRCYRFPCLSQPSRGDGDGDGGCWRQCQLLCACKVGLVAVGLSSHSWP